MMTIEEARRIVEEFNDDTKNPTDEEFFMFTEAMDFLINELHDPRDMMYLGGVYYEMKSFDLALKYYEMAAAMDYEKAYDCLGYIWYYGRTGVRDYKKAFECFSKLMKKGDLVATYKVADMYRNGYYVQRDIAEYNRIIEELAPKVKHCRYLHEPLPEVYTRLARIRTEQGRIDEAINLYLAAKDFLSQRISYNAFFGNLNIMKWLVNDLYKLIEFDNEEFDLFDLYYLMKEPHTVSFMNVDKTYVITSEMEGDECVICFEDKWYHSIDDFFSNAEMDGMKITSMGGSLFGFEVIK